jgi:soluble lytic murein transglycosylase-like protein
MVQRRVFAWPVLAGLLVVWPAAIGAQVLRVEDETGAIHYTNNPCDPTYRRLAPGACAPLDVTAPTPVTAAVTAEPAPVTAASMPLAMAIESTATRYGVDHRLVDAVVRVESGGNPRAVSPKGALGLMQLMPARAQALGIREPFDPGANLDGGVRHLRELLRRYDGNLTLVLAAYNAGEEAVRLHRGVPPFRETEEYVRKVLSLYAPASAPSGGAAAKQPRRTPARSRL